MEVEVKVFPIIHFFYLIFSLCAADCIKDLLIEAHDQLLSVGMVNHQVMICSASIPHTPPSSNSFVVIGTISSTHDL